MGEIIGFGACAWFFISMLIGVVVAADQATTRNEIEVPKYKERQEPKPIE